LADVNSLTAVNDQTLFEAASLAKPVFAYFVIKMVEKGVLDLDTPLYTYLPYPDAAHDERYKLITARIVLNHTTGFPNWRRDNPDKKLNIQFTPGTRFSYSGEGYMYLAKVVAHLLKSDLKNLDSIFQQEVAQPLDIKHAHFGLNPYIEKHLATGYMVNKVVYDNNWNRIGFHPASGLYSEAINYAKFLIGVMEAQGLKQESIDEMLKKQVEVPEDDNSRKFFGITEWSFGFGRKPSPYGTNYIHGGNNWGYTSSFMINREHKFGFVFFTNSNQYNNGKLSNLYLKLEAFLTDGVCNHVPDFVSLSMKDMK
jgi:CubicO group peptidase (beta-lactamase class C family)